RRDPGGALAGEGGDPAARVLIEPHRQAALTERGHKRPHLVGVLATVADEQIEVRHRPPRPACDVPVVWNRRPGQGSRARGPPGDRTKGDGAGEVNSNSVWPPSVRPKTPLESRAAPSASLFIVAT